MQLTNEQLWNITEKITIFEQTKKKARTDLAIYLSNYMKQ
jgi:hypothetical protein